MQMSTTSSRSRWPPVSVCMTASPQVCGGRRRGGRRPLLESVLPIFAQLENDGGDDQDGPVVGGSLGVAGGQGAELLEPREAAFDDVAAA
jgi:hypothetical protein